MTIKYFQTPTINLFCGMILLGLVQCQGNITQEEVAKEKKQAMEALGKAQESITQAFEIKHKYLEQENEKLKENLEEQRMEITAELEKLDALSDDSREIAGQDIQSAIQKFEQARKEINDRIEQLANLQSKEWAMAEKDLMQSLEKIKKTMQQYMKEIQELERFRADTI